MLAILSMNQGRTRCTECHNSLWFDYLHIVGLPDWKLVITKQTYKLVNYAEDGAFDRYLAVAIFANDVAGVETGPINIKEDRILEFDIWENTNQLNVQVYKSVLNEYVLTLSL